MKQSDIIFQLKTAFPRVGGISPAKSNTAELLAQFSLANLDLVDYAPKVIKAFQETISAANEVGLNLTVNNTERAIRDCLRQYPSPNSSPTTPFPSMYKGVSFNPSTYSSTKRQEWVILLDFYALIANIAKSTADRNAPSPRFAILDAGLYWVVNQLGPKGIKIKSPNRKIAVEQLLNILKSAQTEPTFSNIIYTNRVRNAYLRAIAKQFPANLTPPVFTLNDVWNDPDFPPFLEAALDTFCEYKSSQWIVSRSIRFERYMIYSPWVTPLVTAETLFIGEKLNAYGILSPTAESDWNPALDRLSQVLGTPPFIAWMYERQLGKSLPYASIPYFSDSVSQINSKLIQIQQIDSSLGELLIRFSKPFASTSDVAQSLTAYNRGKYQLVSQFLQTFYSRIDKAAQQIISSESAIPPLTLNQVKWLSQFPPGIC